MGAALKEANFSLAGVYYSAGDNIKYQVASVPRDAHPNHSHHPLDMLQSNQKRFSSLRELA
jgi:hypothetical protein